MKLRSFALASTVLCLMSVNASAADVPEYNLSIKDHKFVPELVEIPANTKVKLIVKNEDATAEEFESHDLKREKIIKGGSTGKISIGPLAAGEYKFFGEFHEKTAQGKIVVK